MKYFKEAFLKYCKIFVKFLNISKWNISSYRSWIAIMIQAIH